MKVVEQVRELRKQGFNKGEIARLAGINREIDELSSFTNGVRRDIAAVKNAILLDYHNGLAEGSVNKLKVVKRIMYGRNSFEMLKGKLLRLELNRKIN